MIEIQGGITIGGDIQIGDIPANPIFIVTENDNNLITETGVYFIEEQYE
jgi:hypothetical protein